MVLLSYCISIMNRLYQLKQTLRVNINNSSKNSEFIIVDFNSNDGLKDYIYNNFQNELKEGKLKYYFTNEIKYWHASICKNITHMKSTSKYVVNLDCDNFIGENGDEIILNTFIEKGDDIIITQSNNIKSSGNGGRISILKDNFIKLGGYDETFYPMGYQDYDLIKRGIHTGFICIRVDKNNKALINSKQESIKNIGIKMDYNKMNNINKFLSKINIENGNLKANIYRNINN